MAKQIKIKEIAQMAGVSAGTVDRILHNRGNVSESSRAAVEKVLKEVNYKYNIHTSAVSFRKEYNIVISMPTPSPGEYWGSIQEGIEHALAEYSDISLNCRYAFYNQFDIYSCRAAFDSVPGYRPDAVIIGPTFADETGVLCSRLDAMDIPYVFIDSYIEKASPLVTYTTDQFACGRIVGKIMRSISSPDAEYAIFSTERVGNIGSYNSRQRREGLMSYFAGEGLADRLKTSSFSAVNPEESDRKVMSFIQENPAIEMVAVLNSRGYIIADILRKHGADNIRIISFDLTNNNIRCLKDDSISILLCQRPKSQGFNAVRSVILHLLYKQPNAVIHHTMPVDIILKENLPFYQDLHATE